MRTKAFWLGAVGASVLMLGMPLLGAQAVDLGHLFRTYKKATGDATPEQEQAIGADASAVILGGIKPLDDPGLQDYVNKVGRWVAAQSERAALPWHFVVLDSDAADAFAAPGGYVYVTSGLLLCLHNEAELAGVLGHEISHVVMRHHLRALQKAAQLDLGKDAVDIAMELRGQNAKLFDSVTGASKDLYSHGLDKDDEYEADRRGVVLAARAGYDPYAFLSVLQTLDSFDPEDDVVSLLLATHPTPDDRLQALSAAMSGKMEVFSHQEEGADRYAAMMKALVARPTPSPGPSTVTGR